MLMHKQQPPEMLRGSYLLIFTTIEIFFIWTDTSSVAKLFVLKIQFGCLLILIFYHVPRNEQQQKLWKTASLK